MEEYTRHSGALDSMNCIANRMDIDEAIKYCGLLLASLQQRPVGQITITYWLIIGSGDFLYHAFELTKNPEYLDESIAVHRGILKRPHSDYTQFHVIH